ncbi:MAG: aminopeptidase [Thermosulfidibacteraceae bacterium]
MIECARKVLFDNFAVSSDDRVLVFFDEISLRRTPEVISAFILAANEIPLPFLSVCFKSTGSHGAEPPVELWEILFGRDFVRILDGVGLLDKVLKKEVRESVIDEFIGSVLLKYNVIIALSYYSTTHTIFRKIATTCGGRYASMPLFESGMLCGSAAVDVDELSELTGKVAEFLNKADLAEIGAPNGTFLQMSLKGRVSKEDDGNLRNPGSYGNLPAGEAFIAPVEGTTNGVLVIEYAGEKRLSEPLKLFIKDGIVQSFEPETHYFARFLKDVFSKYPSAANIAELGVGTNRRAKNPANVLEAEKILGTVHIALGDNEGFGGNVRVPFHIDFVVFEPTLKLEVEGRWTVLIERGKLLV